MRRVMMALEKEARRCAGMVRDYAECEHADVSEVAEIVERRGGVLVRTRLSFCLYCGEVVERKVTAKSDV